MSKKTEELREEFWWKAALASMGLKLEDGWKLKIDVKNKRISCVRHPKFRVITGYNPKIKSVTFKLKPNPKSLGIITPLEIIKPTYPLPKIRKKVVAANLKKKTKL